MIDRNPSLTEIERRALECIRDYGMPISAANLGDMLWYVQRLAGTATAPALTLGLPAPS